MEDNLSTETQLALAVVLTPSTTSSATMTSSPTTEPTNTPTQYLTPTQTPGPALRTPFGDPNFQLLVHEIQAQETLTAIANLYGTTVDVLWNLNGLAFRTIQVGDHIVVCMGCTIMPETPPLEPYYLEMGLSINALAAEFEAIEEDLRMWNELSNADWIEGERWVVVPLALEVER